MHDVAVVGGSLAGAMTAHHLASRGLDVVVVERSLSSPKRKACGEGLFPGGVRELMAAGLMDELDGCSAPIEGVRFHAFGAHATARMGDQGVQARGVRRDVLDPLVLRRAQASGAELRAGESVQRLVVHRGRAVGVATASGVIQARAVVGADGLNSRIRRLAGLDVRRHGARYGISAHVHLESEVEPWVDVHFAEDHELYLTPVGRGELNVAMLARRRAMKPFAGDLHGTFEEFLRSHPAMPSGWVSASPAAAAGPFQQRARKSFRSNVILVGDAAGFYDGITGEGMSLALVSARLAADAIAAHLQTGGVEPLRRYDQQRRALARNSALLGRLTLLLARNRTAARWSSRNLGRHPATFERLTAVNAGDAPLTSLRFRDLLALTTGV